MLGKTFRYQLLGVTVQLVTQQFQVIMHKRRLVVTVTPMKLQLAVNSLAGEIR